MKEFEESEKEQRKTTPSPKGQRTPRKQTRPRKSIGTLDENETEEEEENFRRQKYHKSTASQVGIGSLENLLQKVEKPPVTPQTKSIFPKQGLVEDIIGIKPMISDQPIIQTPPRPENKDPREYEPILEKLMREREKQAEEFLKKVPIPDYRGQVPYSQGVNPERNLDEQVISPEVFIKSSVREGRVTTPRKRGDCGKPIGASPHYQVKTRYEVEMDGRRRIGSTEKKGQGTHRWTYPSQPPPPPPSGGGAGGHRGGGGGGDDGGPDDSDDGSDGDDEDESEETDSETSSTQEVPQEELPEELRGQRVSCRRINGRGRGYSQRSHGNPRQGGGEGSSPSPPPTPGQGPFRRQLPQHQPTWVYMIQGPTGPIGPPGQDGRDGRDGANAPPVTIPQPVQPAPIVQNLNATALENSFDRVGQNIAEVLTEQKVANHRFREQLEANNETLQDQTDAMVALADIA